MSKSKPKRTPRQPTLNAIYRQQLALRKAVEDLALLTTGLVKERTEMQARCEKLQFDRGVLIERLRKARVAPTLRAVG